MANFSSRLTALKAVFTGMGCVMIATLIYTISIDGLPFRKDLLTPWMIATLLDYYINVVVLAAWIIYKESSWLAAIVWIIPLVCLGSVTTCIYIIIQLFRVSAEESSQDLWLHLLLRHQNNGSCRNSLSFQGNGMVGRSTLQLIVARAIFSVLGCLMLGVLLYTILTYGSPFHTELLTPWMTATLIDFYSNVATLSVWIGYKESSVSVAFTWIVLLICFGSIATCAYVVHQLFLLSPYDPLYLVLLNNNRRAESRYERTSG